MIFGVDDRIDVSSGSGDIDYALSPVVHIVSQFPDGYSAQGSGILSGANDVITAAHVIYSAEHGGYATDVEVTPLKMGEVKPYGVIDAAELYVSSEWIETENYRGDYALITLSTPIGYQSGWIQMESIDPYDAISETFYSFGYPGDLEDGEYPYSTSGSLDSQSFNLLKFEDDLDAMGGQSGSGLFKIENATVALVGVVSHESEEYNGVCSFDTEIAAQLYSWMAENDATLTPKLDTPAEMYDSFIAAEAICYTFLGREGERGEIDLLISLFESGSDLQSVCILAEGSELYQQRAPAQMNNHDFLTYVLDNVMEMSVGEGTFSQLLALLDGGMSHASAFALCIESGGVEQLHRLELYETWHREYRDFALEAIDNDEGSTLVTKNENSALWGHGGNDTLLGGDGDDYLCGGADSDDLYGGEGGDFFAWDLGDAVDTVYDFNPAEDTIRLRSDFEWSWGDDGEGNLALFVSQYEGIILIGVEYEEYSSISVI